MVAILPNAPIRTPFLQNKPDLVSGPWAVWFNQMLYERVGALNGMASLETPLMDGVPQLGTEGKFSDGLHRHPTDTTRADDSLVVHLAGTETITGDKTFSGSSVFDGTAEFNDDLTANGDALFDAAVTINGESTFNDVSTFNSPITCNGVIDANGAIQFSTSYTPSVVSDGLTYWDSTDRTLATVLDATNGVRLQHGQELHIRAVNKAGVGVTNGQVVYLSGAQGNRPKFALAKADAYATSKVIGVATQDIANNAEGFVTIFGIVRDVNTSGFSDGADLYLSATTAGAMTTTPPASPYLSEPIGKALNSTTNGSILVRSSTQTFGISTGYTTFESDGTMVAKGDATTYNDIQYSISNAKVPAANAPTWSTFLGNLSEYTFAINDYVDLGSQELLHDYVEGSNIEVHVHWASNTLDATARYVKWEIEYTVANMASAAPFSVFPAPTVISAETTIPANTAAKSHIYTGVGVISGTGLKIGAQLKMRLRRIAASSTAPSSNPFCLQVGIHYQQDTMGSRTTTAK
jgi:hypothetical protein